MVASELVFADVACVPAGAVTTYGDVAGRIGSPGAARQVGYALAALPADRDDVPWHRVVNAQGRVSRRSDGRPSTRQMRLLAAEGIRVDAEGRIANFRALRLR